MIKRFLASRAIALVLQGVPGIYLHSLFGTHNDHASVEATHEKRVINRAIVDFRSIMRSMSHFKSKKYRINKELGRMIQVRTRHRAFHPNGPQKILSLSPSNVPLRSKIAEILLKEALRSDAMKEYDLIAAQYYEKGESPKAIEHFKKVLELVPNHKEALLGLSNLYEKTGEGFLTLSAEKVYITQVRDTEEGLQLLASLKDAVNASWEHRDKLKPATEKKLAPRHLDIFAVLPQTNCKQCGEASCLAFAVSLILHKHELEECIPLQNDAAFIDRRVTLEAML